MRKFVNAGGYLYTTDWALLQVVQKAFPGFIEYNGRPTGNDVVAVQVEQTENNLLKHLTLLEGRPARVGGRAPHRHRREGQGRPITSRR